MSVRSDGAMRSKGSMRERATAVRSSSTTWVCENTMLLNARSCGWPSACVRSLRCTSSNRASRFVSSSPRLSSPFSSAKVEGSAKAESSIASASIPAFS